MTAPAADATLYSAATLQECRFRKHVASTASCYLFWPRGLAVDLNGELRWFDFEALHVKQNMVADRKPCVKHVECVVLSMAHTLFGSHAALHCLLSQLEQASGPS